MLECLIFQDEGSIDLRYDWFLHSASPGPWIINHWCGWLSRGVYPKKKENLEEFLSLDRAVQEGRVAEHAPRQKKNDVDLPHVGFSLNYYT